MKLTVSKGERKKKKKEEVGTHLGTTSEEGTKSTKEDSDDSTSEEEDSEDPHVDERSRSRVWTSYLVIRTKSMKGPDDSNEVDEGPDDSNLNQAKI